MNYTQYTLEEYEYKSLTIKIEADDDPENPRTAWDNLGVMACKHSRYILGDDNGFDKLLDALREHPLWADSYDDSWHDNYKDPDNIGELLLLAKRFGFVVLPLYLYDHSGLSMSTGAFSCPWDSGQVGVIFCSPAKIRENWMLGKKQRISRRRKQQVEEVLKGEVETYDQYLRGDVWGYVIEDQEGEELDSCWGFFGDEHCKQEAEGAADAEIARQEKEAAKERRREQMNQFGGQQAYLGA